MGASDKLKAPGTDSRRAKIRRRVTSAALALAIVIGAAFVGRIVIEKEKLPEYGGISTTPETDGDKGGAGGEGEEHDGCQQQRDEIAHFHACPSFHFTAWMRKPGVEA